MLHSLTALTIIPWALLLVCGLILYLTSRKNRQLRRDKAELETRLIERTRKCAQLDNTFRQRLLDDRQLMELTRLSQAERSHIAVEGLRRGIQEGRVEIAQDVLDIISTCRSQGHGSGAIVSALQKTLVRIEASELADRFIRVCSTK